MSQKPNVRIETFLDAVTLHSGNKCTQWSGPTLKNLDENSESMLESVQNSIRCSFFCHEHGMSWVSFHNKKC